MNNEKKLIAIGRSRFLCDSIKYLAAQGIEFKAIVIDEVYEEYDTIIVISKRWLKNLGRLFYHRNRYAGRDQEVFSSSPVQSDN